MHTKGKWYVIEEIENEGISVYRIWCDNVFICEVYRKEGAEYICKAVNEREKLVEDLKSECAKNAKYQMQIDRFVEAIKKHLKTLDCNCGEDFCTVCGLEEIILEVESK